MGSNAVADDSSEPAMADVGLRGAGEAALDEDAGMPAPPTACEGGSEDGRPTAKPAYPTRPRTGPVVCDNDPAPEEKRPRDRWPTFIPADVPATPVGGRGVLPKADVLTAPVPPRGGPHIGARESN